VQAGERRGKKTFRSKNNKAAKTVMLKMKSYHFGDLREANIVINTSDSSIFGSHGFSCSDAHTRRDARRGKDNDFRFWEKVHNHGD
jgi:hypothetical protein